MEDRGAPYRDAVLDAIHILRGQWTVAVLATLATQETQYKHLLPAINAVAARAGNRHTTLLSHRVLSDTLTRMVADGLVRRRSDQSGHFSPVWYSLTPKGRSLLAAIRPLAAWAREYLRDDPPPA